MNMKQKDSQQLNFSKTHKVNNRTYVLKLELDNFILNFVVQDQTDAPAKIHTFSNKFVFEGPENVPNTQKIINFQILKVLKNELIPRFNYLSNKIEKEKFEINLSN